MASTRGTARLNIRQLAGDISTDDAAYSDEQINRRIEAYAQFISNDVYQGVAWVDPFITLVNGTADYTAPAAEYAQIIRLRLNSQNWLIQPVTTEAMEQFRLGTTSNQSHGDPTRYSVVESTTQTLTFRFWPWPDKSDTVAALRSVLVGSLSSDSSAIPFDAPLCRVVEFQVAADLVESADDSQLTKMLVSPKAAARWEAMAEKAIIKEKERQHRLKSVGYVQRVDRGLY